MDMIQIQGSHRLSGSVPISGAKNAALPILMATLVAPGEHHLERIPELVDVSTTLSLLGRLGCPSLFSSEKVQLDTSRISFCEAPYDLVRKMRASVLALGPLLARCGEARVSLPGGCAIGVRPIDQHLRGLEALGCEFELTNGYVHGRVSKLHGGHIQLDFPTVTGTENLLMAAVLARGETLIENAACEPEIVDLVRFLRSLGAQIEGEGSPRIQIQGVDVLTPAETPHKVLPDRIEAGTYLVAGAITGGDVTVCGVSASDMLPVLDVLRQMGCEIEASDNQIRLVRSGELQPIELSTQPHPGFPTDMQAQIMALTTLAQGRSIITENIFENRFMHVPELVRMGAQIEVNGNTAVIQGVEALRGASVMATDLRASASLVLAGLAAIDKCRVLRLYHLDRGYAGLVGKLQALGAQVQRVPEGREETTGLALVSATG